VSLRLVFEIGSLWLLEPLVNGSPVRGVLAAEIEVYYVDEKEEYCDALNRIWILQSKLLY